MFATRILLESVKRTIARLQERRVAVAISEADLVEDFSRGSGPGGQAVNKASNAVNLLHSPSGIRVRCHMSRSLELNRREARRMLLAQLDDQVNGEASKGSIAALKERERKRTRGRKSARKHGGDDAAPPAS